MNQVDVCILSEHVEVKVADAGAKIKYNNNNELIIIDYSITFAPDFPRIERIMSEILHSFEHFLHGHDHM